MKFLPPQAAALLVAASIATPTRALAESAEGYCEPLLPHYCLRVGDATVVEGNAGARQAVFSITLHRPSPQPVTVQLKTVENTATDDSLPVTNAPDFREGDWAFIFQPGQTLRSVSTDILGDATLEAHETFFVDVTAVVGSGVFVADGRGVGTITNDDLPRVSIGDASVSEGDAGSRQMSFSVSLSGDIFDEPHETVFVNLSNIAGGTLIDAQGRGTIVDNDPAQLPCDPEIASCQPD